MRKWWIALVLLLCLPALALAQEAGEMPPEAQAMLEDYHGAAPSVDYLELALEDGRRALITVTDGYSVVGFQYADGAWAYNLMTFVMDELRPAYLERVAGDADAFRLCRQDGKACMTYRYDGECFRLTAWEIPGSRPVTAEGELLRYGSGASAAETVLPGGVTDWPWSAEDLPLTPEEAMKRALITEQNVSGMFPGYTLRSYESYNDGRMAAASFSRVKDGMMWIRRVALEAGCDPQVVDCLPVPLSGELAERLERKPFDSLVYCMADGSTFLTQDAFDRGSLALPAGAVLLDNQVQERSVIALVEEKGTRYLYVWEPGAGVNGDGFAARRTLPLPEDASLDIFHAGDGCVQLEWEEQRYQASFFRAADGQWLLQWIGDYGSEEGVHLGASAFGVWVRTDDDVERLRVGTLAGRDLFTVQLDALQIASPRLDRTGWAVVNNPDPADRLHLRNKPDRSSSSQGKLYNGTPLRVLGSKDGWTQVQLGMGASARTGWMMTKYLAFGERMDAVASAWPDLFFRDEYAMNPPISGDYRVVGVEGDRQYILLGMDGTVVYVPQGWLWEGNG